MHQIGKTPYTVITPEKVGPKKGAARDKWSKTDRKPSFFLTASHPVLLSCVNISIIEIRHQTSVSLPVYCMCVKIGWERDLLHVLLYIGKLMQEKNFSKLMEKWFSLSWIAHWCHQKMPLPQISRRKLSRIATKPQNSQKFSPLKVSYYTRTISPLWCTSLIFSAVCDNTAYLNTVLQLLGILKKKN